MKAFSLVSIGTILLKLNITAAFLSHKQNIPLRISIPQRINAMTTLHTTPAIFAEIPSKVQTVTTLLSTSLEAGPYGVVALAATSFALLLPITQYKNVYGVSVGYGASIAAIGFLLLSKFDPTGINKALVLSTIFYGIRLAGFLLIRDVTGWKPKREALAEPTRLRRIPFALSLSLFYGFLTTPVLYALRHPSAQHGWQQYLHWTGTALAWTGVLAETIADGHKFLIKAKSKGQAKDFHGPYRGLFRVTRHPNYTGEVLYWVGTYVAAMASFGTSMVGWLCSTVGVCGIYSVMKMATRSLEKRQQENYGGQERYEDWKRKVPAPLIPYVKG